MTRTGLIFLQVFFIVTGFAIGGNGSFIYSLPSFIIFLLKQKRAVSCLRLPSVFKVLKRVKKSLSTSNFNDLCSFMKN